MERKHAGSPDAAPTADCCVPRALWGWSPPVLPADTPVKRRVDRLMPRTGGAAILFVAGLIALLNVAPRLPKSGELALDGFVALAAASWCGLNFWRCRHAHCLVTSAGWLVLGAFSFVEAGLGRSLIHGDEQLVFLAVLVAALGFEGAWYVTHGTNAVAGRSGAS